MNYITIHKWLKPLMLQPRSVANVIAYAYHMNTSTDLCHVSRETELGEMAARWDNQQIATWLWSDHRLYAGWRDDESEIVVAALEADIEMHFLEKDMAEYGTAIEMRERDMPAWERWYENEVREPGHV